MLGGLLALIAAADDWPQFQGPRGDGTSAERGLLRAWPAEGPPVRWRAPIKMGWASPSVVGDDVLIPWTEQPNGMQETVACLNAADGAVKWKHTYDVDAYWKRNIGWAKGGFRSTPAVDGHRVYTLGAVGHLHCLDRLDGKVVWVRNLWDEWHPSGEKGYDFSPVLAGGKLILYYGDGCSRVGDKEKARVVLCRALDPATGETLWTFEEPHRDNARMGEGQTPAIADFGGRLCAVFTGNRDLVALALDDGKPVWRFEAVKPEGRGTTIPTPLVLDRLIVNIPDLDYPHAVALDRATPAAPARIAWKKESNMFTAIHQFRHRDGFLYGFAGQIVGESEASASESVLNLSCMEAATGKIRWSERGFRNGVAIIEADGLLFVRSYQALRLVEATPDGFRPLGEVKTHAVKKATLNLVDLFSPVLSRGALYVRTPDELILYDVAAK
jgi:outer membrane protein assembly factor BamB